MFTLGSVNKRYKTLSSTDTTIKEYVDLCFSGDSKYLVAVGGAPDFTLIYWNWDKGKILSSVKIMQPVTRVSFSPFDNAQLAVSGPKLLRLYRSAEGQLKPINPLGAKREPQV